MAIAKDQKTSTPKNLLIINKKSLDLKVSLHLNCPCLKLAETRLLPPSWPFLSDKTSNAHSDIAK